MAMRKYSIVTLSGFHTVLQAYMRQAKYTCAQFYQSHGQRENQSHLKLRRLQ